MTLPDAIPLSQPEITRDDQAAVNRVMQTSILSRGPELTGFEQDFANYCQIAHAVGVSSGTTALEIILRALDIGPADEVISPSFTVPATANAIANVGARPVFVDIEDQNLGLCLSALQAAVSGATKAIVVVHAFGMTASIKAIATFARENNLYLIEDACEALGTTWCGRALGTIGDAGAFGFYPNKQITTGEGGMIITADAGLAATCRQLRNNGRSMNGEWLDQEQCGQNARLPELAAALGRSQLSRIEDTISRRAELMQAYRDSLESIPSVQMHPIRPAQERTSWFACVVRLACSDPGTHRDRVMGALTVAGIQTGRYFAPLHLQPAFRPVQQRTVNFPVTERIANASLTLPFFNHLTDREVARVCSTLEAALAEPELELS